MGSKRLQQRQGTAHLLVRLFGVVFGALEEVRTKGTVEIPVAIPTPISLGTGIAGDRLHLATAAIDQSWMTGPLLQQPGAIDLIAVGARHHQHSGLCHHNAALAVSLADNAAKRC